MSEYMAGNAFTPAEIAEGDRRVDAYQTTHHKASVKTIPFVLEPESETLDGKIPAGMTAPAGVTQIPNAAVPISRTAPTTGTVSH